MRARLAEAVESSKTASDGNQSGEGSGDGSSEGSGEGSGKGKGTGKGSGTGSGTGSGDGSGAHSSDATTTHVNQQNPLSPWTYFHREEEDEDQRYPISGRRHATVDASFKPKTMTRLEYQVQAWNGHGASPWSALELCDIQGFANGDLAMDDDVSLKNHGHTNASRGNNDGWTLWSILMHVSAVWNAVSFLGYVVVVLCISMYSFAPTDIKKEILSRIQACFMYMGDYVSVARAPKWVPKWCPCARGARGGAARKGKGGGWDTVRANLRASRLKRSASTSSNSSTNSTGSNDRYNGVRSGSRLSVNTSMDGRNSGGVNGSALVTEWDPDSRINRLTNEQVVEMKNALNPNITLRKSSGSSHKKSKSCCYVDRQTGKVCGKVPSSAPWATGLKHNCRYCMKWYCHDHTAFANHGRLFPCQMKSCCVCVTCAMKKPLTPDSRYKKNRAGKKFDFKERRVLD